MKLRGSQRLETTRSVCMISLLILRLQLNNPLSLENET